jgi:hypothetical protein
VPRRFDIFDYPIHEHVHQYHPTGRSDSQWTAEIEVVDQEEHRQPTPTTYDILATRKIPEGYPAHFEHQGPVETTWKHDELVETSLAGHLHRYPVEIPAYSPRKVEEQVAEQKEPKKSTSFFEKLFKSGHSHMMDEPRTGKCLN